jgi:hypothetical protein
VWWWPCRAFDLRGAAIIASPFPMIGMPKARLRGEKSLAFDGRMIEGCGGPSQANPFSA